MDRGRMVSAVVLALAVLALGTVAGGLSSGTASDGSSPGFGVGSGEGSGIGEDDGTGLSSAERTDLGFPPWLGMGALLAVLWGSAIVAGIYLLVVLWKSTLRELLAALVRVLGRVVAIAAVTGLLMGLLFLIAGLFGSGGGGLGGSSVEAGMGMAGDSPTTTTRTLPAVALLAGAGLLIVGALLFDGGDDSDGPAAATLGTQSSEAERDWPVGTFAADGAVDDPGAANEVYRTWTAFRDRVGPRGAAESPEELQRRALAAGYDERAVGELTSLFNAVRYGDAGATPERERRARELDAALSGEGASDDPESRNP